MADARRPLGPNGLARALDEATLETALFDLGRSIAYPTATGDLAASVGERLRREPVRGGGFVRVAGRPVRASFLLAAALVLLAAAVVAAAVIGLPGIRIVFGPMPSATATLVAASPVGSASAGPSGPAAATPTPSPTPGPLGSGLGLGQPIDPATLDATAGRHVPVPAALGPPVSAWLDTTLGLPVENVVWAATSSLPDTTAAGSTGTSGIGAILTAIPATIDEPYLEKVVGSGGVVDKVSVGGHPGYWIGGAPHELILLTPSGAAIPSTTRLAGSSLLWSQDGLTMRLETGLHEAAAVALAAGAR